MTRPIATQSAGPCPACGAPEAKRLYADLADRLHNVPGQWSHTRCACGLVRLDPCPAPRDLGRCYPGAYQTHTPGSSKYLRQGGFWNRLRPAALAATRGYPKPEPFGLGARFMGRVLMGLPYARAKLTMRLGPLLPPFAPEGRLLDVGCGNGGYLALMRALGWDVAGLEVDPEAARVARESQGLDVHAGTLENAPFAPKSFDVITMQHVLEHLPDPVGALGLAANLLKPGGRLILLTPNAQSLGHRWFKQDWYALDPPRHLNLFTPNSLGLALESTGRFSTPRITTLSRDAKKMAKKRVLVRRTNGFVHEREKKIAQGLGVQMASGLFRWLERLGNPFMAWGEEIACVVQKESGR